MVFQLSIFHHQNSLKQQFTFARCVTNLVPIADALVARLHIIVTHRVKSNIGLNINTYARYSSESGGNSESLKNLTGLSCLYIRKFIYSPYGELTWLSHDLDSQVEHILLL